MDILADVRLTVTKTEAQILAGGANGIKAGMIWQASDTLVWWFRSVDGTTYTEVSSTVSALKLTGLSGVDDRNIGVDPDGNIILLDFPEGNVIEISTDTNAVSDAIYLVDTTAGAVTITLPATLEMGFNVRVYKITDINTPEVVIDGNGNLIGTDATQEIVGESEGVSIISDGQYFIVQDNRGGLQRKLSQSTGILSGFAVSTNVDGVSIDIGEGIYVIEDATDMLNPISKTLQYDGIVGYPISNLATEGISFVFIDVDGNLVQQSNVTTTPEQWRTLGRFASVTHFFGTGAIEGTFAYNTPPQNPASRISTYMNTIGIIREGISVSGASANNLQLANTSGELVSPGSNQVANSLNPDNVSISAQDPVPVIIYLTQNDVDRMDTAVDVLNYDVAGVITLIGGNSTTSVIHRVYMGIDGTTAIQYGQNTYSTLVLAQSALFNGSDDFVQNPILNKITTLLGYVIATKGATNLNDQDDALFFVTDKFGGGGSISQGGAGTSTTQEGYDNSIQNPELLTNDTRLSLDIRNGSSSDTNSVLTVQNIAGANVLDVKGDSILATEDITVTDGTSITTVASGGLTIDIGDAGNLVLAPDGTRSANDIPLYLAKESVNGDATDDVNVVSSNGDVNISTSGAGDVNISPASGTTNIDRALSTNDATEILALGGSAFQTADSITDKTSFAFEEVQTGCTIGDDTSFANLTSITLGRFFTTTQVFNANAKLFAVPDTYLPTEIFYFSAYSATGTTHYFQVDMVNGNVTTTFSLPAGLYKIIAANYQKA